jgi:SAM-dependent methyltransferase
MDLVKALKRVVPRGLHALLGAARGLLLALPPRTSAQKARLLGDPDLDARERELLRLASSRIHYRDDMYKGDGRHYYKVGLSALRCIDEALASAGGREVRTLLDLPCGYGRELRFLVHRFPQARITACEIERPAVRFCARELGAVPAYSRADLDTLSLEARFDLIWCGSLATHFDADPIHTLLELFRRHLAPGGLAVFTTHGDFVARRLPAKSFDYSLTGEQASSIADGYAREGFAYTNYRDREGYGISLASPAWVRTQARRIVGLREVYFKARGWDDHQDVYGFVLDS